MRYQLSVLAWTVIEMILPNKLRGLPRVNDRRVFNKIKQCRRIATRCDDLAADYLAFIKLASIRIWLCAYVSTS